MASSVRCTAAKAFCLCASSCLIVSASAPISGSARSPASSDGVSYRGMAGAAEEVVAGPADSGNGGSGAAAEARQRRLGGEQPRAQRHQPPRRTGRARRLCLGRRAPPGNAPPARDVPCARRPLGPPRLASEDLQVQAHLGGALRVNAGSIYESSMSTLLSLTCRWHRNDNVIPIPTALSRAHEGLATVQAGYDRRQAQAAGPGVSRFPRDRTFRGGSKRFSEVDVVRASLAGSIPEGVFTRLGVNGRKQSTDDCCR